MPDTPDTGEFLAYHFLSKRLDALYTTIERNRTKGINTENMEKVALELAKKVEAMRCQKTIPKENMNAT